MSLHNQQKPLKNPILRTMFQSWIQACGEGWTHRQVLIAYAFSVLFAVGLLVYASMMGLGWSWIQMCAAGLIAWDLTGGVIGYNHHAIKRKSLKETSKLSPLHHNLQHIHPLILMFFNNESWLLGVTIYWFITFFLYVEFLEIKPATGQRRIGKNGQHVVIGFECAVALFLITSSFFVADIPTDFQVFGICVYSISCVLTLILMNTPLPFQRTTAIIQVVGMIFLGMMLFPPDGFQWVIPVYFLKLLVGFTAKEAVDGKWRYYQSKKRGIAKCPLKKRPIAVAHTRNISPREPRLEMFSIYRVKLEFIRMGKPQLVSLTKQRLPT